MRAITVLFLAGVVLAQAPGPFQPVGTTSQVMISITYPTSDAIFYVQLMMGRRARDQGDWVKESQELVDVGAAAYKAALAKDLDGIVALNQRLNDACVVCHQQYRPNYRKRK